EFRFNGARADDQDVDAVQGELGPQAFGPPLEREFAGAILHATGDRPFTEDRADVDDHRVTAVAQVRQGQARQLGTGKEIYFKDPPQPFFARFDEGTAGADAGVVNKDVESAEGRGGRADQMCALSRVRDIGRNDMRFAAA